MVSGKPVIPDVKALSTRDLTIGIPASEDFLPDVTSTLVVKNQVKSIFKIFEEL